MRAGAQTLALLASPVNWSILHALAGEAMQQSALRSACGSPAQTTLRAQLKRLEEVGAIVRRRRNRFPGAVRLQLSESGRALVETLAVLERWLADAPEGPLHPGTNEARTAIVALAEGWSTAMLRVLAAEPLTLTELDGVIGFLNYPALERRLTAMRLAGLVSQAQGDGRGTPYTVCPWARQGLLPITAAARWERRHLVDDSPPLTKLDVECCFLLAFPLLRVSDDASGSWRLTAETEDGPSDCPAGVLLELDRGRAVSCTTRPEGSPKDWIAGPQAAWQAALLDGDFEGLELGGDRCSARSLLTSMRESLRGCEAADAERPLDASVPIREDQPN